MSKMTAEQIVYDVLGQCGMLLGTRQRASRDVVECLRAAGLLRARLERTPDGYILADPVADTIARVVGIPCNWQQVQDIAAAFRAEGLLGGDPTDEPLKSRPKIGQDVKLLTNSSYLAERFDAPQGSIGTVVEHSRLTRDDTGVLVRFGEGSAFRCDLHELAAAGVAPQEPNPCNDDGCLHYDHSPAS